VCFINLRRLSVDPLLSFLSGEEGPKGGENETRGEIHVGYC